MIFTVDQLKHHQQNDVSINRIITNIDKKPFNDEYWFNRRIIMPPN